jgi:hypothetical protein
LGDHRSDRRKGTISGKIAKDVFEIVWTEGGDPRQIVEDRGMKQVTDTGAIEAAVDEVIAANPDKVAKAGQGERKAQACRLVRRPGDEGHRRQGQPAGGGFTEFEVTNGPDLEVWLVADDAPFSSGAVLASEWVSLGQLKGNIGDQTYTIPDDVDVSQFGSVVIWCEQFSVLFSVATLAEPS